MYQARIASATTMITATTAEEERINRPLPVVVFRIIADADQMGLGCPGSILEWLDHHRVGLLGVPLSHASRGFRARARSAAAGQAAAVCGVQGVTSPLMMNTSD